MFDVVEASDLIKKVVGRGNRKTSEWITATFHALCDLEAEALAEIDVRNDDTDTRWTVNRIKEIWYGNARRIDAWEMDLLRQAEALNTNRFQELRNENEGISERLDRLEAELALIRNHRNGRRSVSRGELSDGSEQVFV